MQHLIILAFEFDAAFKDIMRLLARAVIIRAIKAG